MDYQEEQQQELEVLESIYPDELEKISENQFTITILLETDSERQTSVILLVTYPETYPEIAPELSLEAESSEPKETEPSALNFNESVVFDPEDLQSLLHKLIEEAEENVGMPSVFALTSSLKDHGEQLWQDKLQAAEKAYERQLMEKERKEQQKFMGTKVTRESFNEWRLKFRKEFGVEVRLNQRFRDIHRGKPSGREIFEKGLAGSEDVEAEDPKKGVEGLRKGVENIN